MLNDRGVRISDTPITGRRKYLKNMLTDRGVRISDTPIAGRREYLKNMLNDRVSEFLTSLLLARENISKIY
jgi:hypothetical protein